MPSAPSISTNVPTRDAALRNWMNNIARQVSRDPDRFRVDLATAATLMEHADRFAAAYDRAWFCATRSPATIAEKNAIRKAALAVFRPCAKQIKDDLDVFMPDKVALGFKVRRRRRTHASNTIAYAR